MGEFDALGFARGTRRVNETGEVVGCGFHNVGGVQGHGIHESGQGMGFSSCGIEAQDGLKRGWSVGFDFGLDSIVNVLCGAKECLGLGVLDNVGLGFQSK